MFVGCKGKKEAAPADDSLKPRMELSQMDTTAVLDLVHRYFDCLKSNRIDDAMAMLHHYDGKGIVDLPEQVARSQRQVLEAFPAVDYSVDHIIFYRETDSEVKFTATLFELDGPNDHRPNKMSYVIRPMRIDGQWYLTMADSRVNVEKSKLHER